MTSLFPITGCIFLFAALLSVRVIEKRYLAPAAWFFVVFYLHAYVDPYLRFGVDGNFNQSTVFTLIRYTIGLNFCLWTSYSLLAIFLHRNRLNYPQETNKLFGKQTFLVMTIITLGVFCILFVGFYFVGRFSNSKAYFSYGQGGAFRQIVVFSYLLYTFVPALFLSTYFDICNRTYFKRGLAIVLLFLTAAYSMAQFGRQTIMMILIMILMIYHNRVKLLNFFNLASMFLIVVFVTVFSYLRTLKTGILTLSSEQIQILIQSGIVSINDVLLSILTSIPGQTVFSNVISIVNSEDSLWFGKTYIQSFFGLLVPNVFRGVFEYDTPAFWYKSVYAPGTVGHGFDFSMIAESYMNFGNWGVLVFCVVGFVIACSSYVILYSKDPLLIIFGALLIVSFLIGLRNDSNALFTRIFFFMIPIVVLKTFLNKLFRRNVEDFRRVKNET